MEVVLVAVVFGREREEVVVSWMEEEARFVFAGGATGEGLLRALKRDGPATGATDWPERERRAEAAIRQQDNVSDESEEERRRQTYLPRRRCLQ